MNRFQFTIRSSLLAVVGLLCAAVVGLTSLEAYRAWEQTGRAARVAESNRIADLLLTSAGNWAVERGVVNAALAAPDPIDASTHAAIAAAVEQQNAATTEISRNVQEASTGTEEVARNAEGLNAASRETGAAASRVLDVSGGLPRHARELAREVDVFIAKIRAA